MPASLMGSSPNTDQLRSPMGRSPSEKVDMVGKTPVRLPKPISEQKGIGRPGLVYEPVQKLGEGAFGVAHLVLDRRSGQQRVLKTINKRQSQVPPAQLEREIRNLKACDHPNIIRLHEYFEDYENIYLIMERAAGGELHQVLAQQRSLNLQLPERWVCAVMRQCLQAISYVHSQGIMHKDLKSENIMLLYATDVSDPNAAPHPVLIDLGIAELFHARLGRRARCTVVAGTPTHMAPEVWRGNFGLVADVWSLGVVLFELLSGELPFMCSSLNSCMEWIRLHKQGPNWPLINGRSSQARALCQRMLSCDERMRPTAEQCLTHSWIKAGPDAEALVEQPSEAQEIGAPDMEDAAPTLAAPCAQVATRPPYDRCRYEKAVLSQATAQLHTSKIVDVNDVFSRFDGDKTGMLAPSELAAALRELGVEPVDAESYVSCLDNDAEGRVDYTDLLTACIDLLYEKLRGLLWQSFCVVDTDGSGVLGREDIRSVVARPELAPHGFGGGVDLGEVLDHIDGNQAGEVSFDELCGHLLPARPIPPCRPRASSMAAEQLGWQPPGGTDASQPVQGPREPALRDEEFAQLLDEIEADHAKAPSPTRRLHRGADGDGSQSPQRSCFAVSPVADLLLAPVSEEPLPGRVQPHADGVEGQNITVEEELSNLLADIAGHDA